MLEVALDPEVLDRLAARLEVLSNALGTEEREHLLALLGLASSHLAALLACPVQLPDPDGLALGSPGFAEALSPAADAVARGGHPGDAGSGTVAVRLDHRRGETRVLQDAPRVETGGSPDSKPPPRP